MNDLIPYVYFYVKILTIHKILCIYMGVGGGMKRKDIIRKLAEAGFVFEEGGNHTKAYKDGIYRTTIGRQTEIPERIVMKIEKQTGVKLR